MTIRLLGELRNQEKGPQLTYKPDTHVLDPREGIHGCEDISTSMKELGQKSSLDAWPLCANIHLTVPIKGSAHLNPHHLRAHDCVQV